MDNPTRLTLERPAAGAVNIALMIPELGVVTRSCGVSAAHDVTRIVSGLFTLTTSGRVELAGGDAAIVVMLVTWLSGKLKRTRFVLRIEADDGFRRIYELHKGGVAERDPAKPKPKPASTEIERKLQQATARPYSVKTHYAIGEVVEHPSFGRGLVTRLVEQKIVVQFVDAERTLVHARA
jgi:hypothetical protein